MIVTLENPLENYFRGREYIQIINICLASDNECKLRENIKNFFAQSDAKLCFDYGYGRNHFWVCEKETKKRIILVNF